MTERLEGFTSARCATTQLPHMANNTETFVAASSASQQKWEGVLGDSGRFAMGAAYLHKTSCPCHRCCCLPRFSSNPLPFPSHSLFSASAPASQDWVDASIELRDDTDHGKSTFPGHSHFLFALDDGFHQDRMLPKCTPILRLRRLECSDRHRLERRDRTQHMIFRPVAFYMSWVILTTPLWPPNARNNHPREKQCAGSEGAQDSPFQWFLRTPPLTGTQPTHGIPPAESDCNNGRDWMGSVSQCLWTYCARQPDILHPGQRRAFSVPEIKLRESMAHFSASDHEELEVSRP